MMGKSELEKRHREEKALRLAKGLGWFSVALGCAELFAPERLADLIGIRPRPLLTRLLGARELVSGLGILAQDRPEGWVWSRVGGDAMDLALLTAAEQEEESDKTRVTSAIAVVAGVTLLDLVCGLLLHREGPSSKAHAVQTIIINRTPEELFNFWRNLENLPQVMRELESVRQTGDGQSHWVARGPGGKKIEWDAELTGVQPNESISWRARNGSYRHDGRVQFKTATGNRGTIVRVELNYHPPGGSIGHGLTRLFGQTPEQKIQVDLYRMKQIMETGSVMTTKGQPAGRSSSTSRLYDWGTTRG